MNDAAHFSGLQATVLYEISECSEDAITGMDISVDDSDLYLEGSDLIKEKDAVNEGTTACTF